MCEKERGSVCVRKSVCEKERECVGGCVRRRECDDWR